MIRLEAKGRPPTRLSLDGIIPERLTGQSEVDIARRTVMLGTRPGKLGDWFSVAVAPGDDRRLLIVGDGERLDHIGAGMMAGEVIVEGDAGAYAGLGMTGGSLVIRGAAGHGAAVAMAGGELRIGGDAGDELGGARPGERIGMRDGRVIVAGSAGGRVGDRLRRGLIVIGGAAGAFCGARMGAGTIVVGGPLGDHPGIAMRRGTIIALNGAPRILPSFAEGGVFELVVTRLVARTLVGTGLDHLATRLTRLRRWTGDLAENGKGEILAPC